MKVKVSEATGPVLDWMVQEALLKTLPHPAMGMLVHRIGYGHKVAAYSSDWRQGGPIIEEEGICIRRVHDGIWRADFDEAKLKPDGSAYAYLQQRGPTPLIAAMRCYCVSKLGEEVEVPEELVK